MLFGLSLRAWVSIFLSFHLSFGFPRWVIFWKYRSLLKPIGSDIFRFSFSGKPPFNRKVPSKTEKSVSKNRSEKFFGLFLGFSPSLVILMTWIAFWYDKKDKLYSIIYTINEVLIFISDHIVHGKFTGFALSPMKLSWIVTSDLMVGNDYYSFIPKGMSYS